MCVTLCWVSAGCVCVLNMWVPRPEPNYNIYTMIAIRTYNHLLLSNKIESIRLIYYRVHHIYYPLLVRFLPSFLFGVGLLSDRFRLVAEESSSALSTSASLLSSPSSESLFDSLSES